jgi:2-C-methyl-D-erythritol 2,4-cyclodiphosphate synthase
MRIGQGYDVHAFDADRPLVLGGVNVPHTHGLQGHSDADVLLHAICDAILGAAAMRDIGYHFPDTDASLRGASSLVLLEKTVQMVREKGFTPVNIDAVLVLQKPRIGPYVPEMIQKISQAAGLDLGAVNVKGTTTERLGFTGREEGVAAYAVVLLEESLPM